MKQGDEGTEDGRCAVRLRHHVFLLGLDVLSRCSTSFAFCRSIILSSGAGAPYGLSLAVEGSPQFCSDLGGFLRLQADQVCLKTAIKMDLFSWALKFLYSV